MIFNVTIFCILESNKMATVVEHEDEEHFKKVIFNFTNERAKEQFLVRKYIYKDVLISYMSR